MTAFFSEYGLFLAETVTVVLAISFVLGRLFALGSRGRDAQQDKLVVRKLNRKFKHMAMAMKRELLPSSEVKKLAKADKAEVKALAKDAKAGATRKRVFVLDFHGDLRAAAVASLREEVTSVLTVATSADEVVVRLESAGGLVYAYGLAASQLQRVRDRGVPLTVVIDKVAASGGYMMACVADVVVAAPFAVVGSIGVVTQIPNFHRFLKNKDVDVELFTAGEFKRTVTMLGENNDKGRAKLQEELDEAHLLFKEHIVRHRPALDIERVATGEHWYGSRALELGLVDRLSTSDDYLLTAADQADVLEVRYQPKAPLSQRLSALAAATADRMAGKAWQRAQETRLF